MYNILYFNSAFYLWKWHSEATLASKCVSLIYSAEEQSLSHFYGAVCYSNSQLQGSFHRQRMTLHVECTIWGKITEGNSQKGARRRK